MPAIRPISDMRKYMDILKEVDDQNRVYLTRNGRGAYAIMTIEEADELDRLRKLVSLLADLRRTEAKANQEGWISAEELEKELGIYE